MDIKKRSFICTLFAIAICTFLYSQEKPVVTVLPFDTSSGISKDEAKVISQRFETAIYKTNAYTLVEQQNAEQILEAQEYSLSDCTDQSCAVAIGKLLSADNIFIGTVSKLGSSYILTIKLVDIETGNVVKIEDIEANSLIELSNSISIIALAFGGGEGSAGRGRIVYEEEVTTEEIKTTASGVSRCFVKFDSDTKDIPNLPFELYNQSGELLESAITPKAFPLTFGIYTIKATDPENLYYPYEDKIAVDSSNRFTYLLAMEPNFGGLNIVTEPSGASVLLNGFTVGTTPFKKERIKSGDYQFAIQKELYAPQTMEVTIRDGIPTTILKELEPEYIMLTIGEETELEAKLYIDGKYISRLPYSGNLPYKDFNIKIIPDDERYYEYSETILVRQRGEVISRQIEYKGKYGEIWLDSDPYLEGDVYINDELVGKAPDSFKLLAGTYDVEIKGETERKRVSGKKSIAVKEGDSLLITLTLRKSEIQDILDENNLTLERGYSYFSVETDPSFNNTFINYTLKFVEYTTSPGWFKRLTGNGDFTFKNENGERATFNLSSDGIYKITYFPLLPVYSSVNEIKEFKEIPDKPELLSEYRIINSRKLKPKYKGKNPYLGAFTMSFLAGGVLGNYVIIEIMDYFFNPYDYDDPDESDQYIDYSVEKHWISSIAIGTLFMAIPVIFLMTEPNQHKMPHRKNRSINEITLADWESEKKVIDKLNIQLLQIKNSEIEELNKVRNFLEIRNIETGNIHIVLLGNIPTIYIE
jgi:hypothetical protein